MYASTGADPNEQSERRPAAGFTDALDLGHGITKPRAMRAVLLQNLAWFNHDIRADPLPDFTNPEVPKKKP